MVKESQFSVLKDIKLDHVADAFVGPSVVDSLIKKFFRICLAVTTNKTFLQLHCHYRKIDVM